MDFIDRKNRFFIELDKRVEEKKTTKRKNISKNVLYQREIIPNTNSA
jgi:hypothetical protein